MSLLYSKIIGEGKPMVILHGYLGMSDNWKTLGNDFAEAGFQVHLLDLRNHGRSFHSAEFNYAVMAQDVVDYCTHYQLRDIVLIGHSMGGKVAMLTACNHPQLVQKLLVADISPRQYLPHHQDIMQALNAVDFDQSSSRKDIENVMKKYIKDVGVLQFLMKNVHRVTNSQLGFRFNLAAFNQDDTTIGEALPNEAFFDKPTLFLKGSKSKYIQKEDEILIHKHFADAKIDTISDAGHWLHAENPTEFYEKTLAFVNTSA